MMAFIGSVFNMIGSFINMVFGAVASVFHFVFSVLGGLLGLVLHLGMLLLVVGLLSCGGPHDEGQRHHTKILFHNRSIFSVVQYIINAFRCIAKIGPETKI